MHLPTSKFRTNPCHIIFNTSFNVNAFDKCLTSYYDADNDNNNQVRLGRWTVGRKDSLYNRTGAVVMTGMGYNWRSDDLHLHQIP